MESQQVDAAASFAKHPVKRHQLESMTTKDDDQIWENGVKIASWASCLSGICIVSLASALLRYENAFAQYKHLLTFLVIALFLSYICGALMLLVWALCRPSPNMKSVVRRLMLGSIISAVFGVGTAICICIIVLSRNHAV